MQTSKPASGKPEILRLPKNEMHWNIESVMQDYCSINMTISKHASKYSVSKILPSCNIHNFHLLCIYSIHVTIIRQKWLCNCYELISNPGFAINRHWIIDRQKQYKFNGKLIYNNTGIKTLARISLSFSLWIHVCFSWRGNTSVLILSYWHNMLMNIWSQSP